jgi:hypothetical protein
MVTFLSAAQAVLKASKRPLTVKEITDAALRRGLINPQGKTPDATMSATLYVAARNHPNGPIQRKFVPATVRAARNSVRWFHDGR